MGNCASEQNKSKFNKKNLQIDGLLYKNQMNDTQKSKPLSNLSSQKTLGSDKNISCKEVNIQEKKFPNEKIIEEKGNNEDQENFSEDGKKYDEEVDYRLVNNMRIVHIVKDYYENGDDDIVRLSQK